MPIILHNGGSPGLHSMPLDAAIGQVFTPYCPFARSSIIPNVPVCPSSLNAVADMLPTCQKTQHLVCHVGTLGDTFLHHVGDMSSDMLAPTYHICLFGGLADMPTSNICQRRLRERVAPSELDERRAPLANSTHMYVKRPIIHPSAEGWA